MDVDQALEKVGGYRRWHLAAFVLLSLSSFSALTQQALIIVFIGWEPPYHCKVPSDVPLNQSLPWDGNRFSKCEMFVNSSIDNTTTKCTNGVHYYNDGYQTIVTEFDLVCQHDFLPDLSQSIYMFVQVVSDIISSYLIDRFGRKNIHIISNVLVAVLGSAVSLSTNYVCFVVLRTLCGMMTKVVINSGITLLMELFGMKKRTVIVLGMELFWVIAYLVPAATAYLIKDWRIIQLLGSMSSFIWLLHICFMTESVPWLVAKKRHKEAERTLQIMAKRNELKVKTNLLGQIGKEVVPFQKTLNEYSKSVNDEAFALSSSNIADVEKSYDKASDVPLKDLFCDPKLRYHLLMCNIFWFANTMVYQGLILISPSLGPNRFFNYFLMGIVELPSYIFTIFIVKRYGRKIPQMAMFLLTGTSMGIAVFIPKQTAFTLYSTWYLYATVGNRQPSIIRNTTILPDINSATSDYNWLIQARHVFWLPNAIFAVAAIVAGLATLTLPETRNKPLPQTTADVYKIYYNNKPLSPKKTRQQKLPAD